MTVPNSKRADTATLHGLVRLSDAYPTFAIPIFKRQRSDALLAQTISAGELVEDFEDIDAGDQLLEVEPREVSVGEEPIAAFIVSEENALVEKISVLRSLIVSRNLMSNLEPFARLQIARFCRFPDVDLAPLKLKAFEYLHKLSPDSAALWRNIVVLLPAVKSVIVKLLDPSKIAELQSDIACTNCRISAGELSIGLTRALIKEKELAGEERWRRALMESLAIDFELFKIGAVSFREWMSRQEQDIDDDVLSEPTQLEAELLRAIAEAMGQLSLSHRTCRIVKLELERDETGLVVGAKGKLVYLEPKPAGFSGVRVRTFRASFDRPNWQITNFGFG